MDRNQGMQKLREQMEREARRQQEAQLVEERKQQEKAGKRAIEHEKYTAWVEEYRPQATIAAQAIWLWCAEFVDSGEFLELKNIYNLRERSIWISAEHQASEPCVGYPHGRWYQQFLGIRAETLYVHNCVKYGKSHALNRQEDLLKCVAWPILVVVAGTVTSGTIWDIITIR